MGNITAHPDYGSTYDLTHGWLMWGMELYKQYGYMYPDTDTSELLYTKDGKTFGTIPLPSWVREGAQGKCLQTLDNGGDIFLAGNLSYIFRNTDSSWERQPDWPGIELENDYDYGNELGGRSKNCKEFDIS